MRVFVALWLLVTLVSTALAITCFECDSVNEPGCGESFSGDDIAKTDCNAVEVLGDMRSYNPQGVEPTCLTKYYEGMPGSSRFVRRSCFFGDSSPAGFSCDESPDPLVPYQSFLGCTLCNSDLCNAAGYSVPSMLLSFVFCAYGLLLFLAN
ncbi:uncharacterized protein [Drosophila pseudoobscura]|uniref:Uncharacterized protein n=1 Tax=Drosophila pseudoobscura pseudoobscura TaxID=46245 RepID=A0A6I8UXP0_DROPS|nr:uncharacterized protein LOC6903079 [Drosophila pseudoobscura]